MRKLETFPTPPLLSEVAFDTSEFTSFCPVTGQPDFQRVVIEYEPDKLCIESKSLKLYLWSFRSARAFCEALASRIANDVECATKARYVRVTIYQNPRGGIALKAVAEKGKRNVDRS